MFGGEVARLVPALAGGLVAPVCVYGSLRGGQPARARLVDDSDVVAVAAARIPGHRLVVAGAGAGRWAGCAMAVPAPGGSVVGELLVLRPDRRDEVLEALDAYEFAGYCRADPRCPYRRRLLDVLLPLNEWGLGRAVAVPAWVYLPGAPLHALRGNAREVPGGDWSGWVSVDAPALVETGSPTGGFW
ncbi:MAG TPA: gamma-glutamylcyclotransferase family protein [Mycobacteriales bacterium]|nr:gamma-glutamylcyclotransferase family protein [Mycobacteriales bacterium]